MTEESQERFKQLNELRKKIQENPARKRNEIIADWALDSDDPDESKFRYLLYIIAAERGEMAINIINSNVANLNLGQQLGHIESVVQAIAAKDDKQNSQLAEALRALTDAIKTDPQMSESDKKEAAQVVAEIAEQANAKPEERSSGRLKALLAGFPTMIAAAAHLTKLWEHWGPAIQQYFGF